MNGWFKSFTFVVIPSANQSVRRFRLPGLFLIALPAVVILLIAAVIFITWLYSNQNRLTKQLESQLHAAESVYQDQLHNKNEQIAHMQAELLTLSEQAQAIESKLSEINELELELKEMIGLSDTAANERSNLASGGQGGEELPISEYSLHSLTEAAQVKYSAIDMRIDQLQPSLEATRLAAIKHKQILEKTPTLWPADSRKITSEFGIRKDPITRRSTYHSGIDLGGNRGDPIYAAAGGKVTISEREYPYGNYIAIDHGKGVSTRYLHLNKRLVEVGDTVTKGQIIGELGNTGRSTGPHLHYEVIVNGVTVNPLPYMNEDREDNDHVQK
ncbi:MULTISPECIES: M23 family metallopeptidase [unclassified Paenibacillus]|uniref:M23 family metallopeptidase n=1 Tax=unclassified Paenibacillus TaxID=185978 RepID=UPI002F3F8C9A